jgi:hypothetical protein
MAVIHCALKLRHPPISSAPKIWRPLTNISSHGLKIKEPKIAPYMMEQLWFTDPDGYGLCFQWPATQETYDSWVAAYVPESKTMTHSKRRANALSQIAWEKSLLV